MLITRAFSALVTMVAMVQHANAALHSNPDCNPAGQNWGTADGIHIEEGIQYLDAHGGTCDSPALSSSTGCTRVSCSYNSGIFVCNDNNYHVYPTCAEVADMADSIHDRCTTVFNPNPTLIRYFTKGQEFAFGDANGNGKFNVVIRSDSC